MNLRQTITASAAAFALLAATPALADGHVEAAEPGPQSAGPALWKVADEDTTIYLFGTVHALPQEVEWYDEEIAAALTASDTLVTEIRMDPESEQAMQMTAIQKSLLPEGTTLRSLLTEEQTTAYEAAMATLNIPPAQFDRIEPWMAGLTLTMVPLLMEGYSPETGVEKSLMKYAGEKSQDALETAEFQLNIFDTLPQDKQIAFMMEAVNNMGQAKAILDKMVAEWIEGDADGLAELINEGMDDPVLAEALLYNRNANWAQWIDSRLETTPGTVFIAVGAAHLAGTKSVQELLEKRELTVERVQ